MATSQEESASMVVLNTRFIFGWFSYPCTCTGLAVMTCLIIPLLGISQIGRYHGGVEGSAFLKLV